MMAHVAKAPAARRTPPTWQSRLPVFGKFLAVGFQIDDVGHMRVLAWYVVWYDRITAQVHGTRRFRRLETATTIEQITVSTNNGAVVGRKTEASLRKFLLIVLS